MKRHRQFKRAATSIVLLLASRSLANPTAVEAPQPEAAETAHVPATYGPIDDIVESGNRKQFSSACDRYNRGERDQKTKLLCGKCLFLYGNFGASGIPAPFIDVFLRSFASSQNPGHVGPSFSRLGMIPDPTSTRRLPLGLAEGERLSGHRTYVFTCASCHLSRLPGTKDRYAIGAPNHDFEYGRLVALVSAFPRTTHVWMRHTVSPSVQKALQPLTRESLRKPWIKAFLDLATVSMADLLFSGAVPSFPATSQDQHMSWLPGTMDFAIKPLPFYDEVHVVTKIPMIWEQLGPEDLLQHPGGSALLGHTGGTPSLQDFLAGFVATSGGDPERWDTPALEPLRAFLAGLKAPPPLEPVAIHSAARGKRLFVEHGCVSCHNTSNLSGNRLFEIAPFEGSSALAVDPAIADWGQGAQMGGQSAGSVLPPLTGQIKSPALIGLWAQKRFLHNGSVTLEELFCSGSDRRNEPLQKAPFGRQGHWMTCDLPDAETKQAIIDFLRSGERL